jgi:hypothetical protein
MKDILIRTIPHKRQRYDTVGDYFNNGKQILIHVSDCKNEDYEFAVAVHELIEWYLTKKHGIKIKEIDNFDISFKGKGEPGDDKEAPYYEEHQFATSIEFQIIEELDLSWSKYEKDLDNISDK